MKEKLIKLFNQIDKTHSIFGKHTPNSDIEFLADEVGYLLNADIRNKLSPVKNLCAMLKNRECETYMLKNDKLNDLINEEIENCLEIINKLNNKKQ